MEVPVPLQPKRAAVLAYLAIARPGPWQRRDTLLALFWPEADDKRGRSSLSKAIHYLRRSAGAAAVRGQGDEEIGISADDLWCDVVAFEDALGQGALEEAAALYQGDLMEGFHLADAPDFAQWLDLERSRLRRLATEAVWGLVEAAEARRDLNEAARWARQGVDWSPTDEVGLRRLLELLYRRGNRTEAIETFERVRSWWRDEYDIEPSEQTMALVEAIRAGSLDIVEEGAASAAVGSRGDISPPVAPATRRTPMAPAPTGVRDAHLRARLRSAHVGALALVAVMAVAAFVVARGRTEPAGPEEVRAVRTGGGQVVLADFTDASGEEGLGSVVTEALRVDLAQASNMRLVDPVDVSNTLRRMAAAPDVAITRDVAMDVAARRGAEAVLDGVVAAAGSGYILRATLWSGQSGRTLASFRAVAEGPDDVIDAIDRLSRSIRVGLGESLPAVQDAKSLEQVTTNSLAALRLYTDAVRVYDRTNDRARTAHLLEEALLEDPGFAMAWRMLAVALQGGRDRARRTEAIRQAFEHRDRLRGVERHLVEGMYYGLERDGERQVQAYQDALRIDPDEPRALNNLALMYMVGGDFDRAEPLLRKVIERGDPASGAYRNLLNTLISRGHGESAAQVLADWELAYPDYAGLDPFRSSVAFIDGDLAGAARHAAKALTEAETAADRRTARTRQARLAQWSGRLDESRRAFEAARVEAARQGPAEAWSALLTMMYEEALVGDPAWAGAQVRNRMSDGSMSALPLNARRYLETALVMMLSGDSEGVSLLEREWQGALSEANDPDRDASLRQAIALSVRAMADPADGTVEAFATLMREAGCVADACRIVFKAWFYDLVGASDRAIALYERIRAGGYLFWGLNTGERIWATTRLGALYEEAGDTARAAEAYQQLLEQWSGADERGMESVRRLRDAVSRSR